MNRRIRWARQNAGLSQERFAEAVGTSRRHVMRWEKTGGHRPGPVYAHRIAEVTGQPVDLFSTPQDDEDASG